MRAICFDFGQGRVIIKASTPTGSGEPAERMAVGIFSCLLEGIVMPLMERRKMHKCKMKCE